MGYTDKDGFQIQHCTDCPPLRKSDAGEVIAYLDKTNSYDSDLFYCSGCRSGQNEWLIKDMLWDALNQFLVTPCCHGEAAYFLVRYREEVEPW